MITLTCSQCERNLKVKDELAGKKVRCPQCKQALEVPGRFSEGATVPPSGARPQEEGATIPPNWSPPPNAEPAHEADEDGGKDLDAAAHYKVAGEIARGGMGAIKRAVDKDICREVAVKFLLNNADDRQRARFVEEAQITGQLEHPNIVPIHHLGMDEDGCAFFSMKMVKGRSLAEILKDPSDEYTLGRLLNVMISICNALAYAHSRQVIHRDLKPANIMVGDFGEVYVMDWGLAKVLGKEEIPPAAAASTQFKNKSARGETMAGIGPDAKSYDKVTTQGRHGGELTQAGAIMGTPAYMPPEQAQGNLDDVDERSDIYALGAILYEMMTLTPPVGRGGDMIAMLMRVVEGKIDPPAERAPERARAGWVPPELSAVALKALAKKPKHRCQSVEALKRDIELFLEGRSVSAKQDTFREMAWKLLKRNKGVSIATSAALVVLMVVVGFFLKINYDARVVAEQANAKFVTEQKSKREQGEKSAPSFLSDAQHSVVQKEFDHALAQANVALEFDPSLTPAWLLKGQLLIGQKKFDQAVRSLSAYLERKPDDAEARKLMDLCGQPNLEDAAVLIEISESLSRQKAFVLAEVMVEHLEDNSKRLFQLYQQRLNVAWPGAGGKLSINPKNGKMALNLASFPDLVSDLTPLQGMKLESLDLGNCKHVVDLSPLRGMKLTWLSLYECSQVRDLEPIKGMKLAYLRLGGCRQVQDLDPLKGMQLTYLQLGGCNQVRSLEPLKGMKLPALDVGYTQITSLEPLRGMELTSLSLDGCTQVRDLEPLKGMKLTSLGVFGCTEIRNLEPLKGMKLTSLSLHRCQVRDLEPLKGMSLTVLDLAYNQILDLEPLRGMPLVSLHLDGTQVRSLEPLKGMKLNTLGLFACTQIPDLTLLKGMPLTWLQFGHCGQLRDLELLKGMPLKTLGFEETGVTDLRPLQAMQLEVIILTPKDITQGLDILRDMKSLRWIGVIPWVQPWPAAEFWNRYEKGEFKK